MSVNTTDNTAQLSGGFTQKASLALRLMTDAVVVSSDPHTPRRYGNLRRDVLKQVLGLHAEIRWLKNYASYQEDKQYRNYTTPGTGPHFAENAVKEVVSKSGQYFQKAGL